MRGKPVQSSEKDKKVRLFSDPSDHHKLFDAIIIGTGITGDWAAKEMTAAGLGVRLLDAGPFLAPSAVTNLSWWNRKRIAGYRGDESREPWLP